MYLLCARKPITRSSVRFLTFDAAKQPRIRIGSTAPNFVAPSTVGDLDFYKYLGNSWGVLFSHPADFTPVCATELGEFASLKSEFDTRNVKLIGLSADDLTKHVNWVKDIQDISLGGKKFNFPILSDTKKEVAFLYDMVTEEAFRNINKGPIATIRSLFIIDPTKKVRLVMTYPPSVGRNTHEVLRVIDSLQTGDKLGVVTGVNWKKGDDVIIPPSLSDEAAKEKFGNFKKVKPYLRYASTKK
ncbi:peroxiredoxin 1 [Brettanomyces nanus]|uniref:Peroxiredoxin 1 n=1 Tax=Eeniella nana TaxID=13502 RepID=A0A875SD90_EENNA|nr:peroxiredoxin 1 [Brettanomyces nanus]QPG76694.1 peroxiredoxin 1 [Brettanomyces nanus]